MTVSAFRAAFPLGSETRVVAVDGEGRYAGIIAVPEAHAAELAGDTPIRAILHHAHNTLLPSMSVKAAVEAFDQAEAEALAVVDSKATRRVVGMLTEAHALRRYSQESELRRREALGES
jgi:CIC family chloride channel protein